MVRFPLTLAALVAVSAMFFVSCSGGGSGARYRLADDTVVRVDQGTISLEVDGRRLWATPEGGTARARTFELMTSGPTAIYDFRRLNEVEMRFDVFESARRTDEGVEVRYGRAEGDGAIVVSITPGERAGTTRVRYAVEGVTVNAIDFPSACDADGSFHGYGEQYNATEQRGEAFPLFVEEQGIGRSPTGIRALNGDPHTTYFPMPYYMDARGFGVLVDTHRLVNVDVCAFETNRAAMEVVGVSSVDAIVMHGPTPKAVIEQLSGEVGRPAAPPAWAYGVWISAQGGTAAVQAIVDQLETESIPAAAIWSQDWTGVRMNFGGGFGVEYRWEADEEHYPGLDDFISGLQEDGIRFLAYANPFIDDELPNHFEEMSDAGLLLRTEEDEPYVFFAPNGSSAHPDFTQQATFEYVEAALRAMVARGIDGWMADFGEWSPLDAVNAAGEDPIAYHNRFPVLWHQANRQAMDAARPDGDWVLIARSGHVGVQRYSQIHWVGDQEATWDEFDGLPTVVPAMINLGLAGVPYVTHDIAGFSGGPSTEELYNRWTELGAFTPIMRTHEGNERDENWNWNASPETIAHFRRFVRIHDALRPELMAMSDEAQESSVPLVRHLMLEFPDDRDAWAVHDQYMLGADLLIAPVTTEGATSREVYLPEGTWFHVFTGDSFTGPMRVTVDAPIGTPPVFSRGEDRTDLRAIE